MSEWAERSFDPLDKRWHVGENDFGSWLAADGIIFPERFKSRIKKFPQTRWVWKMLMRSLKSFLILSKMFFPSFSRQEHYMFNLWTFLSTNVSLENHFFAEKDDLKRVFLSEINSLLFSHVCYVNDGEKLCHTKSQFRDIDMAIQGNEIKIRKSWENGRRKTFLPILRHFARRKRFSQKEKIFNWFISIGNEESWYVFNCLQSSLSFPSEKKEGRSHFERLTRSFETRIIPICEIC